MAEKQAVQNSVNAPSANGNTPNTAHKCEYDVMGCIWHAAGSTMNQEMKHLTKFIVHFRTEAEIHAAALESFTRVVAASRRLNKSENQLPIRDTELHLYADMSFTKTLEDYEQDLARLSDAEKAKAEERILFEYEALMKLKAKATNGAK